MTEDSRPVPDPTVLTTQQLLRELLALRELIETRIEGIEALYEEKFRASKEAVDKAERSVEQRLDVMSSSIGRLANEVGERMPKGEYTRAHEDLAQRLEASSKHLAERIDALEKAINERINRLTQQLSEVQAVAR